MFCVLGVDSEEYQTILVCVFCCHTRLFSCFDMHSLQRMAHELCHTGSLDFSVPYKEQESAALGKIYKVVCGSLLESSYCIHSICFRKKPGEDYSYRIDSGGTSTSPIGLAL